MDHASARHARALGALGACFFFLTSVGCGQTKGQAATRPSQAPSGAPTTPPASADVGPGGGTVSSRDGRVTVSIPQGALPLTTTVSIQTITNTAPGGIGSAYRIEPSGTTFAHGIAITFRTDPIGTPTRSLGVSYQDASGYWVRVLSVLRNSTANLVTATTTHFSDWALVPSDPTQDLAGGFTVSSTLDAPASFTASGSAALAYAGEDAVERVYLLSGAATLQPVTYAGVACTPDANPKSLIPNIAELFKNPPNFEWGASAQWSLTCGTAPQFIEMVLDTAGISHVGCGRGYTVGVPGPVATADAVSGDYTIDCTSKGTGALRVNWSFLRCGSACTSSNACATSAAYTCTSGSPVCTVLTTATVGTACTTATGVAGVCDGTGTCTACATGATCTSTNPCAASATVACGSGAPVCTDQTFQPPRSACVSGTTAGVCSSSGTCSECALGATCVSANPCAATASIDCATGTAVCKDQTFQPAGTACSSGTVTGVCSGSTGVCTDCASGTACTSTNPCATVSSIVCGSGAPVCADTAYDPDGTVCSSTTNSVCLGNTCTLCSAGASCVPLDPCHVGSISCGDSTTVPATPPGCVDTGVAVSDGTACNAATNGVCLAGACTTCVAGASCTPANVCDVGTLTCGDPTATPAVPPTCTDSGTAVTCPTGQTCSTTTGTCS